MQHCCRCTNKLNIINIYVHHIDKRGELRKVTQHLYDKIEKLSQEILRFLIHAHWHLGQQC